ncbi:tetratricopeptide repeat protein [Herbaspirillum lusitanum]|uniref:Tetratricopeptide repeat protein n=1 Tax=Herbaspirillum lusitanum TaxID=213312 RepID=A0ABW9AA81_9BURK
MNMTDAARLEQLMSLMCESIALGLAQQTQLALARADEGLALQPDFFPLQMQRGRLLQEQGHYAEAAAAYQHCLNTRPDLAEAGWARERALLAAVQQCEQQLRTATDTSDISHFVLQRAQALHALGRHVEALDGLAGIHAGRAGDFDVLNLQADILLHLNRHEEALACYVRVSAEGADFSEPLLHFNRGNVLRQMGRMQDALAAYEQALAAYPQFAEARVARGHILLMHGQYEEGWREHEARRDIALLKQNELRSLSPRWQAGFADMAALHQKTVLLWAEQGLGDTLQFARYIPLVAAMASQVIVCVPPSLKTLLESVCVQAVAEGRCRFIDNDKELPPHDLYCSLISLPLMLEKFAPAAAGGAAYLAADPVLREQWAQRLEDAIAEKRPSAAPRLRIGLAWAGRQYGTVNHSRDMRLAHLQPLFDLDADFISLQQSLPEPDVAVAEELPALHSFALEDWSQTAALLANLDLVIAVDTSIAHLAGALGKPLCLMLRLEGEWRWGVAPHTTDWYASAHLFRQSQRGEWGAVVAAVRDYCAGLIAVA